MGIANGNKEGGKSLNLQVVYLSVDALTPYEKNAKTHHEEDVAAIAASIRMAGFCDPIGIWGANNLIVEGHGRLLAAKECGLETVPCIRLDHLTDDERRAYALAHNKTAELSGWDFSTLEAELDALAEQFDMTEFGFDTEGDFPGYPESDPEDLRRGQQLNNGKEIDIADYSDDKFNCKCPKCGFRFNV